MRTRKTNGQMVCCLLPTSLGAGLSKKCFGCFDRARHFAWQSWRFHQLVTVEIIFVDFPPVRPVANPSPYPCPCFSHYLVHGLRIRSRLFDRPVAHDRKHRSPDRRHRNSKLSTHQRTRLGVVSFLDLAEAVQGRSCSGLIQEYAPLRGKSC